MEVHLGGNQQVDYTGDIAGGVRIQHLAQARLVVHQSLLLLLVLLLLVLLLLVLLLLLLLLRPQSCPLPDGRHSLICRVAVTQPWLLHLCWAPDWQVVSRSAVDPGVVALHTGG